MLKKYAFLSCIWVLIAFPPLFESKEFAETDSMSKQYVVEKLTEAIPQSDALLIQFRNDEIWREDFKMPIDLSSLFCLSDGRLVSVLKGTANLPDYSLCYFYPPPEGYLNKLDYWIYKKGKDRTSNPTSKPILPPYMPTIDNGDEYVKLVFARKVSFPFKERLYSRAERFAEAGKDLQILSEKEFLNKYEIAHCFSNYVYAICSACAFRVDVTAPDLPKISDPFIPSSEEMEKRKNFRRQHCNLIHLSSTEVSEIVYLAYRLKGYKDGRAEYKAACVRNPQILKPVEKLQTEIGRMLAKELYPKGLVEFRDGEK